MVGLGKPRDWSNPAKAFGRTAVAGVIGGTASAIGGGKFANGAYTAAFQHLLNHESGKSREEGPHEHPDGAAIEALEKIGQTQHEWGGFIVEVENNGVRGYVATGAVTSGSRSIVDLDPLFNALKGAGLKPVAHYHNHPGPEHPGPNVEPGDMRMISYSRNRSATRFFSTDDWLYGNHRKLEAAYVLIPGGEIRRMRTTQAKIPKSGAHTGTIHYKQAITIYPVK